MDTEKIIVRNCWIVVLFLYIYNIYIYVYIYIYYIYISAHQYISKFTINRELLYVTFYNLRTTVCHDVKILLKMIRNQNHIYIFLKGEFYYCQRNSASLYSSSKQIRHPRLFLHQLTVQGVVSPHPRPPVAYNCCVSLFSKHMQDWPNNIATDWWDLYMQIR